MKALSIVIASFVVATLVVYWIFNHSGYFPYSHNPMQFMPDMHRSQALKPQRAFAFSSTGSSALTPPAGTLAREIGNHSKAQPDPYPFSAELRGEDIPPVPGNPYEPTRENVLRGKAVYETYCQVCHGHDGLGGGPVVGPYPRPPALVTDKLVEWEDNQMYHVIMVGQNQMYPYAHAIRESDRWKLIHYVRVLQMAYSPSDEDFDAFENYGRPLTDEENP